MRFRAACACMPGVMVTTDEVDYDDMGCGGRRRARNWAYLQGYCNRAGYTTDQAGCRYLNDDSTRAEYRPCEKHTQALRAARERMPERRDPSARESKEEEIAAVNTAVATLHGVEVGSGEYSVEDVLAWHDNDADEMRAAVARVRKRLRAVCREEEFEINIGARTGDIERVLTAEARIDSHVVALKAVPREQRALGSNAASVTQPVSKAAVITDHVPNQNYVHTTGTFASDLPDEI